MNRILLATAALALGIAATGPSFSYPGEDREWGPPAMQGPYPPFGQYPPRDGYPPSYDPYGGRFDGAYPPPHAARPPAPYGMPHGSAPDTAGPVEAARRLYTVADTVALRGASLCAGNVRPHTGFRTFSSDNLGPQAPHSARPERVDASVTVFTIARDGPAARAGLKVGDKITAINGESIPSMAGAMSIYRGKIEAALGQGGTISVAYAREGERGIARIVPAQACAHRVVFANSPMMNAATDGQSVTVMRGLVTLLVRDEELALVIGHEIGHNVLGHFARGRELGHQSGPFNPGTQPSMRQFEKEADYIGLYFVALAGYDMESAIRSSQRMAAANPGGERGSATHPSQAERQAVLIAAMREIRAKLARGEALKPSLRSEALAAPRYRGGNDYYGGQRLPIQ